MTKTQFRHQVISLSERLFPMVSRMLGSNANAEDAIQEIMMKLWVKREQVGQHPNIPGFVFLTARNYCIDLKRKKKLKITDAPLQPEMLKSESEQEQLEWKDLNTIIIKILENLPEQQREVIMMRDLDGVRIYGNSGCHTA